LPKAIIGFVVSVQLSFRMKTLGSIGTYVHVTSCLSILIKNTGTLHKQLDEFMIVTR